jgi:hypothetical protein
MDGIAPGGSGIDGIAPGGNGIDGIACPGGKGMEGMACAEAANTKPRAKAATLRIGERMYGYSWRLLLQYAKQL